MNDGHMKLNNQYLVSILANIGDGLISTDISGYIQYINSSAENLTGWTSNEAIGRNFDEVFPIIDMQTGNYMENPISRAIKANGPVGLQNNSGYISKNGIRHYASASCSPVKDAEGKTSGVVVVFRDIHNIKVMEEQLKDERNNLKSTVDNVPVCMLILDENMIIQQANKVFSDILGFYDNILGKKFGDSIACTNSFKQGCGKGENCTFCLLTKNVLKVFKTFKPVKDIIIQHNLIYKGKEKKYWFKVNLIPVSISGIISVIVTMEDISKRIKNEDELNKSNQYLLNLLDGFSVLVWKDSADRECEYVNKCWCEFTGDTVEDALKDGWLKYIHPDDVENCIYNNDECVKKRVPYTIEYRMRRKDGKYRWMVDSAKPIYDHNGEYSGYIGVLLDITDRKEYEINLGKISNFYLRIFENFPAMIWKTDQNGKAVYVSNGVTNFSGKKEDNFFGDNWLNFIQYEDRARCANEYITSVSNRLPYETEVRWLHRSGEYHWIHVIAKPLYDINGIFDGYIGMGLDINDRKIAEEGRIRYEILSKKARDIMLFTDLDGNILDGNEAATKAYGYTLEELCSLNVRDLRAEGVITKELLEKTDREGVFIESAHYRKDGSSFPIEISSQGADVGNKRMLVSIIRDITERKKAEAALRENEEKYRQIFHNSSDTILVQEYTEDGFPGHFIEVNNTACSDWGYTREELLGLNLYTIKEFQKEQYLDENLVKLNSTGSVIFETTAPTKSGEIKNIEVNAHKVLLQGKSRILTVVRDITQRKQAEEELKESRSKYQTLLMNMENGFAYFKNIYDEKNNFYDCKFIDANIALQKLTGTTYEELKDNTLTNVFPELFINMAEFSKLLDVEVFRGVGYKLKDYYIEKTNRWCSIYIYSPERGYFAIILSDITEEREASKALLNAKEAAEAANKAKSEFLANMSHEIRTPINGIVGMIDLTMLTSLTDEQKDNLVIAKNCANSLLSIINDILDFSKMEAGKLSIEKLNFDVKILIDEICKTHTPSANDKGIELSYSFSSNIPQFVIGDPNRLKQVLNNLISNAIKFTSEGEVNISMKKILSEGKNIELKFAVSDTGIGIAEDEKKMLFKTFSQVDGSITRKFGGTGLGLVISKQLTEIMGGKMWVESEKGKGSTFYFTVKLNTGTSNIVSTAPIMDAKKVDHPVHILLAEDDEVNQIVISRMLKEKGYTFDLAGNGLEALELHKQKEYDIILMDIQMPLMDGLEAARHIRERETDKHTPIIALTAYALQGDRERFLNLGMDEYLPKPIQMNELFYLINKMTSANKTEIDISKVRLDNDGNIIIGSKAENLFEYNSEAISEIEEALGKLVNSVDVNKTEVAGYYSNKLKQLCNRIGADDLKSLAFQIELAVRRNNFKDILKNTRLFEQEFTTFKNIFISERNDVQ